jgi:hypothetical protein
MSLAGRMDKASSLSCLCLSSDQTARPPVQIVLPYSPDPIMGGPTCRSRREARTLLATSNIEPGRLPWAQGREGQRPPEFLENHAENFALPRCRQQPAETVACRR